MAFIGRPAIWGLAYNGKEGVQQTLEILRKELDSAMALSGNTGLSNIGRDLILTSRSMY